MDCGSNQPKNFVTNLTITVSYFKAVKRTLAPPIAYTY